VIIRREQPGDEARIHEIHSRAFRRPEAPDVDPVEAKLVDDLRASSDWVPELSLVALRDQEIVGHVVCSRGVVLPTTPALGLGPLGVEPAQQANGVGLALVHAVLGASDALGAPLVALLGAPGYYSRFGFVASTTLGIEPPEEHYGDHFQVRTLAAYDPSLTGKFQYAAAFDAV
jgi:putative acetyltransferase